MNASRTVFSVPNTEEGQQFLRLARKFLNSQYRKMRVKGRGKNRKEKAAAIGRTLNSHHDLPLSVADSLAIYIDKKRLVGRKLGDTLLVPLD